MSSFYGPAMSKFKVCLALCAVLMAGKVRAEGSKELNATGGSRAFLVSGTTVTASFLFPTPGTMKVYAKAGETINVGSSVQGNSLGTIVMRAPNGATYTSGKSTTIGLIANRTQEVAGPLPNANGYTPYTRTVQPAEAGVWEVDFIAQNGGVPSENPVPIAANANWTQFSGQHIAAFDITVRTAANVTVNGRVYTNIFSGILGSFDAGFNGVFQVLTKDGYTYKLENNGQAGNGFSFFVNNKGFRNGSDPSYKSVDNLDNPNIQDPRSADTETDITYKIFFNEPSADLPLTAPTPEGSTWLLNPIVDPALTQQTFIGAEGTTGIAGTFPLGGVFSFNVNKNGTYTILIDADRNGSFTDAIDRKLTGIVKEGTNTVAWDGINGLGGKAPVGNYTANLSVTLFGGEVHFPFFDVERNVNGIKLTRNNGNLSPDFTVYWDDSNITPVGTPSNPLRNVTTGLNSQVNGHKWGSAGASPSDFGDEKGLDTWAYIASTIISKAITLQLQEADLRVSDISANNGGGCLNQPVSYTFRVSNSGPNDVIGSKFSFAFPADLTNVKVARSQGVGTVGFSAENTGTTGYTATLSLTSGAVATFVVTGTVPKMPTSGMVTVTASILRTTDMTDPDATNPDGAPPTDPQNECDSAPSGTGCNNVKTNVLAFIEPPDPGKDQTVFQNDIATLTAVGAGTWAQLGNFPTTAVLATPAALQTTVSGLTNVGKYSFTRANAAGCLDTVYVNVVPKTLDIPTVITPNGDGKNDTFVIPNIDLFPGTQLYIVNRWGNEVYRSENYNNTWSGQGLNEGTYYYVLNRKEPNGGYTTFKGWLFLKR